MGVAAFVLVLVPCCRATSITHIKGLVEFERGGVWSTASLGLELKASDSIRTGRFSDAELRFDDGSRIQLGASTTFELKEAQPNSFLMRLGLGTLRAWVARARDRRFQVTTPTAVCAVRGTEFRATVGPGGNSVFDLYEGLLGIGDGKGNEKLLNPGQRLEVTPGGLGEIKQLSRLLREQREQARQSLHNEVALNMSKEQVLNAAAQELRLAEYQTGKAMIDVSGNRVRLEQYILRPQPDQFKLVVLNSRASSFNYFYYLGTFNQALPTDLSVALKQLGGAPNTPPQWYLTGYQTVRSNTTDSVVENAAGGHLVNINNSPDPSERVSQYFDATLNQFVDLPAGSAFYKTLFDSYQIAYNGTPFLTWSGTNIQSMTTGPSAPVFSYIQDNGSLGSLAPSTNNDLFPDFPLMHQKIKNVYGSGTYWEQYDNYLIDDAGTPATIDDFSGITTGAQYLQTLLRWNFEQVVTSSQFGGRSIDLVIEPKTLIQSGIISNPGQ